MDEMNDELEFNDKIEVDLLTLGIIIERVVLKRNDLIAKVYDFFSKYMYMLLESE